MKIRELQGLFGGAVLPLHSQASSYVQQYASEGKLHPGSCALCCEIPLFFSLSKYVFWEFGDGQNYAQMEIKCTEILWCYQD